MKILFKIFIFLFFFRSFSQEDLKDTTWYGNIWQETGRSDASFYRIYKKTNTGYVVYDKYLSGQNQMIAEASAVKPDVIKQGQTVYFYGDGARERKGSYNKNSKIGIWISYFDHEKDSSITNYKEDGSSEMIRRSALDEVYTIVEKQAEFPGGIAGLMKFLQQNIKYPEIARSLSLGGKVFLKFVIDEEGYAIFTEVLKGTGIKELDEEALRVVKMMPQWTPASMSGRKVKCYFNLPVSFTLESPFYFINTSNKDQKYVELIDLVLHNEVKVLKSKLESFELISNNIDILYIKGVTEYYHTKKKSGCEYFKRVTELADPNTFVHTQSKKNIDKYCN